MNAMGAPRSAWANCERRSESFFQSPTSTKLRIFAAALAATTVALFASFTTKAAREDTPNVVTEIVHFDSNGFNLDAFLAKPSGSGAHPAVLVIHDNMGLNDSMKEIAKNFAAAGFVALAPDFTSRLGGTRTVEQMPQAINQLPPNASLQDARAAFTYLKKDGDVDTAQISAVGFGWGGWRSFSLAVSLPELHRAVVYCGATPSQNLDAVRAPVLAQYAQFDFRTTGNALLTEKLMTDAGKKFTYYVYPKTTRSFYAQGPQFDAEAAKLAWNRTLEFLQK